MFFGAWDISGGSSCLGDKGAAVLAGEVEAEVEAEAEAEAEIGACACCARGRREWV